MTIQTRRRATLHRRLAACSRPRPSRAPPRRTRPSGPGAGGHGRAAAATVATTQDAAAVAAGPRLDIYGFAMLDMGYQSGQNDPDWYDVVAADQAARLRERVRRGRPLLRGRPPEPPRREGLHAHRRRARSRPSSSSSSSAPAWTPGQTTFRLRHAWGELGQVGAGQTWSPFMDPDVFPNSDRVLGPDRHGLLPQRPAALDALAGRGLALRGRARAAGRVRRPGRPSPAASSSRACTGRFPLPDLSAQYRRAKGWGHVQVAGIVREMKWDDLNDDEFDLSGDALGWGINLSSNIKFTEKKHVARLQSSSARASRTT